MNVDDDAVDKVMQKRIRKMTAGKYDRRMNEFKIWLFETGGNGPDSGIIEKRRWSYLTAPPGARPGFNPHAHSGAARRAKLNLTKDFVVKDWTAFIMTRTMKTTDMLKGIGSLAGYRSAFNNAWTQAVTDDGAERPVNMQETIKHFFTGLAKLDAEDRLGGTRKQKVGKDALPFEAYR